MLPNVSETPLQIEPARSRLLLTYTVLIHALAGLVVFGAIELPWYLQLASVLVIALSLWFSFFRLNRLHVNISKLVWYNDGGWSLYAGNGVERSATLARDSYVSRYLVILRLITAKGIISLPLLNDSLDKEQFRRLRVRLNQARLADTGLSSDE